MKPHHIVEDFAPDSFVFFFSVYRGGRGGAEERRSRGSNTPSPSVSATTLANSCTVMSLVRMKLEKQNSFTDVDLIYFFFSVFFFVFFRMTEKHHFPCG